MSARLHVLELSELQISEIQAFCMDVQDGLEQATFEDKQRYLELLDVQCVLATENDEKVVHLTCQIGKQRVLQTQTSPLQSSQKDNSITLTARLVIEALKKSKTSP